jgi:outer membrane murein-binding lipoprotein Lpp
MPRKYTKKRKGGYNSEKLQSDFEDLEKIVERLNNDVKELKEQLQSSSDTDNNIASGVEEIDSSENEPVYSSDLVEDTKNDEIESNEPSLDSKKEEITELIAKAKYILYDGTNCDFKMKQKPCSTGKDTLDGFERSMNKLTSISDANSLKENIENYISRIKSSLNVKDGGRKTKKHKKRGKKHTKRRR